MKTECWGDGGAVEIQGLAASKLLTQLTQDEFLLGGRYADTPPRKWMPDLQMSAVVLRWASNAGGAGGLRRGFGIATDLGFWILADV